MDTESAIRQIDSSIESNNQTNTRLARLREFVENNAEDLVKFAGNVTVWNGQIDFDYCDRPTTLEVIKTFHGKWTKRFNDSNGKLDYEIVKDGIKLRCWGSPPLESCKVVEFVETIPARVEPAQTVTKFRMDCGVKSAEDVLTEMDDAAPELVEEKA